MKMRIFLNMVAVFLVIVFYNADASGGSLTDNGDGTVTDKDTGLIWQKEDDNKKRIWSDANNYSDNLTLAGYTDWRLPSKKELISIVDYGANNPSINKTYFPNTDSSPIVVYYLCGRYILCVECALLWRRCLWLR